MGTMIELAILVPLALGGPHPVPEHAWQKVQRIRQTRVSHFFRGRVQFFSGPGNKINF